MLAVAILEIAFVVMVAVALIVGVVVDIRRWRREKRNGRLDK